MESVLASPGLLSLCLVLLVPGAFGPGTSSVFLKAEDYFSEYRRFFEAKGCKVRMAEFPPDSTIEERGMMLRDQAERFIRQEGGRPLWLLAHSEGGLDSRFAIQTMKVKGVTSLVTLGTPHRGTPLAGWAAGQREKGTFLYWLLRVFGYDLKALPFLGEMTPEFLVKHQVHFADLPGIRYGSARGVCKSKCHWGLKLLKKFADIGEGDGIVPAESQRWGADLGEYDLDHIQEVGADPEKRAHRDRFLEKAWAFFNSP